MNVWIKGKYDMRQRENLYNEKLYLNNSRS